MLTLRHHAAVGISLPQSDKLAIGQPFQRRIFPVFMFRVGSPVRSNCCKCCCACGERSLRQLQTSDATVAARYCCSEASHNPAPPVV